MICENCNKEHDGNYGSGRFCSKKCARGFATKIKRIEINQKVSKTLTGTISSHKDKKKINGKWISLTEEEKFNKTHCKYCGALKKKCLLPSICGKYRLFDIMIDYFGFNKNTLGTIKIYEEYNRIKNLLIEEYYDNNLSLMDIGLKYNYLNLNIIKLFDFLKIKRRDLSKSITLSFLKEDRKLNYNPNCTYKTGWHITWNNKKIFYRSSYELEFCKKLDDKKIDYEVEKLRILYWDSKKLKQRVAIPDFYILNENKIIEIKSFYTYDEQNMNDKVKAYKEHGYNFELYLEDLNNIFQKN